MKVEEIDVNKDIFHYLHGEYKISQNNQNSFSIGNDFIDVGGITLIPDPSYDTIFKALFMNHEERFKNFLNSIYFELHGSKIDKIKYLIEDYYQIGSKYNLNTFRVDISCKAKIKNKNTLIDTEIQIGWLKDFDEKLFEYGSLLKNKYSNKIRECNKNDYKKKRIYINTIIFAFIIGRETNSKKSCEINLIKKYNDSDEESKITNFQILEIDVSEIVDKIQKKERIKLFDSYLDKDGEDWIKLIGMRCWAQKSNKGYKYYFPKLKNNQCYSNNIYINDAILELMTGKIDIELHEREEDELNEREEKGGKKTEIKIIYEAFNKDNQLLKFIKMNYKYQEEEVINILNELKIKENYNSLNFSNFCKYLKSFDYLIN